MKPPRRITITAFSVSDAIFAIASALIFTICFFAAIWLAST